MDKGQFFENAIARWSVLPSSVHPQITYKQLIEKNYVRLSGNMLGEIISDFGVIQNVYLANGSDSVMLIEDIPWNWSARLSIAEILRIFINMKIIGLIATDGAAGYINTTKLSTFPIPEVKKDVALYFLKQLKLNAAEYCHSIYSEVVMNEYHKEMSVDDDALIFSMKLERELIDNQELKTFPICGVDDWNLHGQSVRIWKSYPEVSSTAILKFRELENQRAVLILKNLLYRMNEVKTRSAALICCGHLPDLICTQMENMNISYIRIKPKVTAPDEIDVFLKEIRGELSPLEKLLQENLSYKQSNKVGTKIASVCNILFSLLLIKLMQGNVGMFAKVFMVIYIGASWFWLLYIYRRKYPIMDEKGSPVNNKNYFYSRSIRLIALFGIILILVFICISILFFINS